MVEKKHSTRSRVRTLIARVGGKKPLEPGVDYTVKVGCFYSHREYRTLLGENTLSDQSMRFASIDGHVIKKGDSRDFALVLGQGERRAVKRLPHRSRAINGREVSVLSSTGSVGLRKLTWI